MANIVTGIRDIGAPVQHIKFVDLKQSKVDWDKSVPEEGKYVFKDKVVIDYRSDASALPEHKVQWCRNAQNDLQHWIYSLHYDFVRVDDKHYWPEGIKPNAEGMYVNGDLILMQCPAILYAERKKREIDKANRARKDAMKKFEADTQKDGMAVGKQLLSDLLRL
uniref:Uncharacterized protein n=1 Tax=viral metagenome TaxID=1070528 RepID=A0A6M3K585_9ZZZZ